jgi:hypothetical protein
MLKVIFTISFYFIITIALIAQNQQIIVVETSRYEKNTYGYQSYVDLYTAYRNQNLPLCDQWGHYLYELSPTTRAIQEMQSENFINCFSVQNKTLIANGKYRFWVKVILNENAVVQAAAFNISPNMELSDTEKQCLLDFCYSVQFEYKRRPQSAFILWVSYAFPIGKPFRDPNLVEQYPDYDDPYYDHDWECYNCIY